MGTIRVFRASQGYMVNLHNAHNANQVLDLFGSFVLPTAYTLEADPDMVETSLTKLNPNDVIVMDIY